MVEEKETPLFIKVENYKEVTDLMRSIKRKVEEAKATLERIYAIKSEEDVKIEEWDDLLRDLEKKTAFIDDTLLESKG
jgi:RPA family protein